MLIECAGGLERGDSIEDDVSTRALDAIRNVEDLATESFEVRAAARESVSVDGGLEGLRQALAVHLDEARKEIMPLVNDLKKPTRQAGRRVREQAEKMLD